MSTRYSSSEIYESFTTSEIMSFNLIGFNLFIILLNVYLSHGLEAVVFPATVLQHKSQSSIGLSSSVFNSNDSLVTEISKAAEAFSLEYFQVEIDHLKFMKKLFNIFRCPLAFITFERCCNKYKFHNISIFNLVIAINTDRRSWWNDP